MAHRLNVAYKPGAKRIIEARLQTKHARRCYRATVREINDAFPGLPLPGDRRRPLPPALSGWSRAVAGTGFRLVYTFGDHRVLLWTLDVG